MIDINDTKEVNMYCPECGNKIYGETKLCPKCNKMLLNLGLKTDYVMVKTPDRPLGLVLTVLYCAFSGIISLIIGVPLLSLSSQIPSLFILSLATLFFGIFYLAMSYGLWVSQNWGIPVSIKILYLSIPFNIISLFIPIPGSYSGNKEGMLRLAVVGIIITVIVILYLKNYSAKK
jgi:hypothetical protein